MLKSIIKIMLICFVLNMSASAMNSTIYSYTVEDDGLNLIEVTVREGTETLEITDEIGGVPVTSIDDNFLIRQVDAQFAEYGEIRSNIVATDLMVRKTQWGYVPTVNHYDVKTIIVPDSVKRVSGNMVRDFSREGSIIDLSIPSSAVITDTTVPDIYIYAPYFQNFYIAYGRSMSEGIPLASVEKLREDGTPADLYVDGEYIDGCIQYNGVSYVPFHSIAHEHDSSEENYGKNGPSYSIWNQTLGGPRSVPQFMVIECKLKTPEKFLDENSAYTDEDNAKYEMTARRLMFDAYTNRVITIEVYRPIDENEVTPLYTYEINGVSGGEVKIETMPVYSGYIPVRMVCEAAQRKVEWDSETNAVYVTTPEE